MFLIIVRVTTDPKIMKMKMFAALDKAKPDIENVRGLNLAAVSSV
jgi:hypothetical protein